MTSVEFGMANQFILDLKTKIVRRAAFPQFNGLPLRKPIKKILKLTSV